MRIAVITPVLNRQHHVIEALNSLRSQTYPRDRLLAVVVDDGSADRSGDAARAVLGDWGVEHRVLRNEEPAGPAVARNRAIRECWGRADAFLLLDSDDRYAAGYVARVAAELARDPGGLGLVYADEHEYDVAAGCGRRLYRAPFGAGPARCGGSYAVAKWALEACGLFDERLPVGEADELAARVGAATAAVHVPEALVFTRVLADSLRVTVDPRVWEACRGPQR
jgi:glycosyltransferase involved in cell wall biosynthesis